MDGRDTAISYMCVFCQLSFDTNEDLNQHVASCSPNKSDLSNIIVHLEDQVSSGGNVAQTEESSECRDQDKEAKKGQKRASSNDCEQASKRPKLRQSEVCRVNYKEETGLNGEKNSEYEPTHRAKKVNNDHSEEKASESEEPKTSERKSNNLNAIKENPGENESAHILNTLAVTPKTAQVVCSFCDKVCDSKTYSAHLIKHTGNYTCKACDQTFHSAFHLRQHRQKKHRVICKGTFLCKECGKGFHTELAKLKHERQKHVLGGKHQCSYCGKLYVHKHRKNLHERTVHHLVRDICQYCGKMMIEIKDHEDSCLRKQVSHHKKSTKKKLGKTKNKGRDNSKDSDTRSYSSKKKHPQKSAPWRRSRAAYACKLCCIKFELKSNYEHHIQTCSVRAKTSAMEGGDKYVICAKCHNAFSTTVKFLHHYYNAHQFVTCNQCGYTQFPDKETLQMHLKIECPRKFGVEIATTTGGHDGSDEDKETNKDNSNSTGNMCPDCEVTFGSEALLEEHKTLVSETKSDYPRRCMECIQNNVLNTLYASECDMLQHKKDYKYVCILCGRHMRTPKHMQHHFYFQHGTRYHNFPACKSCHRLFPSDMFDTHMAYSKKVTDGLLCKCLLCGQEFETPKQLDEHTKKYKIHCKECGAHFMRLSPLMFHLQRIHNFPVYFEDLKVQKYKDLICRHCGKSFLSPASLRTHLRSLREPARKSVPKYLCKHCNESFGKASELSAHIKSILDSSNKLVCSWECEYYQCFRCGISFKSREAYDEHLRRTALNCYSCHLHLPLNNHTQFSNHIEMHDQKSRDLGQESTSNSIWIRCKFCKLHFDNKILLNIHQNKATELQPNEVCENCGVNLKWSCEKPMHQGKHNWEREAMHKSGESPCNYCESWFPNKVELSQHLDVMRLKGPRKKTCKDCGELLIMACQEAFHAKRHSEGVTAIPSKQSQQQTLKKKTSSPGVRTCKHCHKQFSSTRLYNYHILGNFKSKCPVCGERLKSRCESQLHRKKHTQEVMTLSKQNHGGRSDQFRCIHCSKLFFTLDHFKSHYARQALNLGQTCLVCGDKIDTTCQKFMHKRKHAKLGEDCSRCREKIKYRSRSAHVTRLAKVHLCLYCGTNVDFKCQKISHETRYQFVCHLCKLHFQTLTEKANHDTEVHLNKENNEMSAKVASSEQIMKGSEEERILASAEGNDTVSMESSDRIEKKHHLLPSGVRSVPEDLLINKVSPSRNISKVAGNHSQEGEELEHSDQEIEDEENQVTKESSMNEGGKADTSLEKESRMFDQKQESTTNTRCKHCHKECKSTKRLWIHEYASKWDQKWLQHGVILRCLACKMPYQTKCQKALHDKLVCALCNMHFQHFVEHSVHLKKCKQKNKGRAKGIDEFLSAKLQLYKKTNTVCKFCRSKFKSNKRLMLHISSSVRSMYAMEGICKCCQTQDRIFTTKCEVDAHFEQFQPHLCKDCNMHFASAKKLEYHRPRCFFCHACQQSFSSGTLFKKHHEHVHVFPWKKVTIQHLMQNIAKDHNYVPAGLESSPSSNQPSNSHDDNIPPTTSTVGAVQVAATTASHLITPLNPALCLEDGAGKHDYVSQKHTSNPSFNWPILDQHNNLPSTTSIVSHTAPSQLRGAKATASHLITPLNPALLLEDIPKKHISNPSFNQHISDQHKNLPSATRVDTFEAPLRVATTTLFHPVAPLNTALEGGPSKVSTFVPVQICGTETFGKQSNAQVLGAGYTGSQVGESNPSMIASNLLIDMVDKSRTNNTMPSQLKNEANLATNQMTDSKDARAGDSNRVGGQRVPKVHSDNQNAPVQCVQNFGKDIGDDLALNSTRTEKKVSTMLPSWGQSGAIGKSAERKQRFEPVLSALSYYVDTKGAYMTSKGFYKTRKGFYAVLDQPDGYVASYADVSVDELEDKIISVMMIPAGTSSVGDNPVKPRKKFVLIFHPDLTVKEIADCRNDLNHLNYTIHLCRKPESL